MSDAEPPVSRAVPSMAEQTRAFDWAATPLGPRDAWSPCLRITVETMLASGYAMCLMWGAERTFLYNDAYAPVLGARHPGALGLACPEVWPELWPEIGALVDRAFAGETVTFRDTPLTMTRNGYEEETWWDFAYSPVRDEHGAIVALLDVCSDSTARVLAERARDAAAAELRTSEAFLSSVLAASTDCIKVIELDGTLSFMSEGGMGVMEVSDFNAVKGCPWPDLLRADGPDRARAAIAAAIEGRTSHFEAPADTFLGTPRHWSVSVSPILGPDGATARVLSVSRDHTELAKAREQQELVNGELAHRIKNLMSVVQAIVSQTLGKVADREAMRTFEDRMRALSRSHDMLTGQGWSRASLRDAVHGALRTFGEDRFEVAGADIEIGPRAMLSLSLMLHELATNAVKYGSLGAPTGKVLVEWSIERDGGEDVLVFRWAERGGPPAVAPEHRGFGSRVIRMGLTGSGGVELDYGEQGLTLRARAPVDRVQEA